MRKASEEGRRHDYMRSRWNRWLYRQHGGHGGEPGLLFEQGACFSKTGIARRATHALGVGSSVTYARYVEEDVGGGFLDEYEEHGMKNVERTGKPFPFPRSSVGQAASLDREKEEQLP